MRNAVQWFVPGRRRAVAYTTTASRELIELLAGDGLNFSEAVSEIRWDDEARAACAEYVTRGYGDTKMRDLGIGQ